MQFSLLKRITGLFIISTVVFGNFSAFAQRRATQAATQTVSSAPAKAECNGGYNGTVNYTKTVSISSTGAHGSFNNTRREYQTTIQVRDNGQPQGSAMRSSDGGVQGSFNFTGRATGRETEKGGVLKVTDSQQYCSFSIKGTGPATRLRCESKMDSTREATGTTDTAGVYIGLRGRTMKIGLTSLPKLNGKVTQTSSSKCSGTCTPDKPINASSTLDVIDAGERTVATDEGVIPFNPDSFNRLSGSWTRTSHNTTETFTWNLSRCAAKLEIADLRFEHKRVPDPDTWVGIDPLKGTIDGNRVRIKAKVFNNGGDTAYANVKFIEIKSGEPLPDGDVSVAVNPGEFRDLEYEWDTSGYAWDENRKNTANREIKAVLEGGNTETAKIKILPKPVVMVHGLWANETGWADYPQYLREVHSFAWRGYAVGADPEHGKMSTGHSLGGYGPTNTVYQNAQELAKQIKFAREENNAWHIDLVAHSMGGLISRQYINTFMKPVWDGKPEVTHLVMLGTPNMGSPCADTVNETFEETGNNDMQAMRELKPIIVRAFNARVTERKGVRFSVLIGVIPAPFTCLAKNVFGDGVVPIESAKWNLTDYAYVGREHTALTGREDFDGFVMPRIAIGPKKARAEQQATASIRNSVIDTYASADIIEPARSRGPSAAALDEYVQQIADETNGPTATVKKKVELQPRETATIDIPVSDGDFAAVVIAATPSISATLTDDAGKVVGTSPGGMEALNQMFRTIAVSRTVKAGVWRLRLENIGNAPTVAFVAGMSSKSTLGEFTLTVGKAAVSGIPITAKLTGAAGSITGARVSGKIVGDAKEITFLDDGKHGDGAANDGVYGAMLAKPLANSFIEAKAEYSGAVQIAVAKVAALPAAAPNQKPR